MATNLPKMSHCDGGAVLKIAQHVRTRLTIRIARLKKWWRHYPLGRIWRRWTGILDMLPDSLFAPKPEPLLIPPTAEECNNSADQIPDRIMEDAYKCDFERTRELFAQRKTLHDEMSKTIRRVFYALVSASLFCFVTVVGAPNTEVLTPETAVELPALNYAMDFEAFLLVGPIVLIALTIYLHIFVGQHRRLEIASVSKHPMLPNFSDWTPRLALYFIFYWMVPVTLGVFAWKAWPRPIGPILGYVTLGVTAALVLLQIRRCGREWRAWALPLLAVSYILFYQGFADFTAARKLNLSMANLSGKDLRALNLSGADLTGADLSGADLRGADLSGAMLHKVNLSGAELYNADLSGANLTAANLSNADLIGARIEQYVLDQACGNESTLLDFELKIKDCPKEQHSSATSYSIHRPPA